jgi:hypothetical protein
LVERTKTHSDTTKKFSEADTINMLEFLIDNILVMLGGRDFKICPFLYIALHWLFFFMKDIGPTPLVCPSA